MTVHTAIEFHARQFTSAAECIANAQRLKRMFAPRREPQERVSAKPAPTVVGKIERQHDAHVIEWRAFLKESRVTPASFLKTRCKELAVDYDEIIGPSRVKRLVHVRHQLMVEVKTAFPKLSIPYVGNMFGRDHTIVVYSFEKMGIPLPKPITLRNSAAKIKEMLAVGASYADIGRSLNYSASAIQMFAIKSGWAKANRRTRVVADHAETVERMWRDGAVTREIAEAIDFEPCSVNRYIARQGWQRP